MIFTLISIVVVSVYFLMNIEKLQTVKINIEKKNNRFNF